MTMKPKVCYESPYWVVEWQNHDYKFRDPDLAMRFANIAAYGAQAEVP